MRMIGQILRALIEYKAAIGIAGLIVIAALFVILRVLTLPVFREITPQQTFDILSLIVNNTFYLAYAAVALAGIGYLLNFLPPIWVATAEYGVVIFRMFDPVVADPLAAINDRIEPLVGFPYYSRESDHPSQWPSRVDRDRAELGAKYEEFFGRSEVQAAFSAAGSRRSPDSSVQVHSSAPDGASPIAPLIVGARMLFNMTLEGSASELAHEIGQPLAEEFLAIETQRNRQRRYFPNRIAIMRIRNTSKTDMSDLTVEFSVAGAIYDMEVRAATENVTETGWQTFRDRIIIKKLLPKYTLDIIIWYHYQSVDERVFPDKINFIQELTQGFSITNIAVSNGRVRYDRGVVGSIEGYDKLYAGDARAKDNYDDELAVLFEDRGKKAAVHFKEYEKKNPTLKDLSLDQMRNLDVPDEQLTSVWVSFRSRSAKSYTAVHVFEHPSGPYILLSSTDRDKDDFKITQADVALAVGGEAEPDITDRSDDICSQILVTAPFTKHDIAACFTSLEAKGFTDIQVPKLHYRAAAASDD